MTKTILVCLYVLGVLGLVLGPTIISHATGAVHEIEGLIAILIGVVALGSATIVSAIARVTLHVERGFAEAAIARRGRGQTFGAADGVDEALREGGG